MDALFSYGPSFIMAMLGVLLLFAAIVGGGLEIKELKIPKIDKTPQILTALLGMVLVMCGGVVGVFAFANSVQQPAAVATMDMTGYVTVSAAPTMDMSGYVPVTATSSAADYASVVIHDFLAKRETSEAVDVVIAGVKRGSIIIGTSRPSDSITITMPPGTYSYELSSSHTYETDSTIYYGSGHGTIEIAAGKEYNVLYNVSGQSLLLYLSPTP